MDDFTNPESWLLSMGYMSDSAKQNLTLYGYMSVPGVQAAECVVDSSKHLVRYVVALDQRAWRWYKLQKWLLSSPRGLLGKLLLLLILRWKGSYEPEQRISRCAIDYLGKGWSAKVEVVSAREYVKLTSGSRREGWFLQEGDGSHTEPR